MTATNSTAPVRWTPVRTWRNLPPVVRHLVIVIFGAVLAMLAATQVSAPNNQVMADGVAMSVCVLGLSWLTGWSGQVSIGNSGFVMIGAYAAAICNLHHPNTPLVVLLLLGLAFGAVAGLIMGLPSTRLHGPYLAGFTIAFAVVLGPFLQNLSSITQGQGGINFSGYLNAPGWFAQFFGGAGATYDAPAEWTTDWLIVAAAVAFFLVGNLFRSRTGRAARLVRDNDVAAELMGVHVARTKTLAFVISAALGGLSGAMFFIANQAVNPNTFPFTLSVTILTVMVLGGIGTLSGAVIAGIIYAFSGSLISTINSWIHLNHSSNLYTQMNGIIFGGVLILTMILAPQGMAGATKMLWHKIRQWRRAKPAAIPAPSAE
jgi:branched-chain amino acid transport system permease protein